MCGGCCVMLSSIELSIVRSGLGSLSMVHVRDIFYVERL